MGKFFRFTLFALRILLGWIFLYSGLIKIQDHNWSAAPYLKNAQTFPDLYHWLALPSNIGWVNFLNEWGMLLIGISLILGLFVRYSSIAGIIMMVLYYFPTFKFPIASQQYYIVDEHIVFIFLFLLFISAKVGQIGGLDRYVHIRR